MKTLASVISCILTIALAAPAGFPGQTRTGQDHEWIALATMQPGSKIVVEMKEGERIKGKLLSVSENSVSLTYGGKRIDLDRVKVMVVWQTVRSLKKPVLVGTAIGAGAGAGLGAAVGGCSKNDFICFERKVTIPIGAAVCGMVGALSGLIVGLLHDREIVVYQASR